MFEIVLEYRNKGSDCSDYWMFLDRSYCGIIGVSEMLDRKHNYEIDNPNREVRIIIQDAKQQFKDLKVKINFIEKRETEVVLDVSKDSIEYLHNKHKDRDNFDINEEIKREIAREIATNDFEHMDNEELKEHIKDQFSEFDIISVTVID